MAARQRLRIGHIKDGGGKLSALQCYQQIVVDEMSAASSVHQSRTMRQHREQTGIENRMRLRSKWKQANENVAAREEFREGCLTGVAGNTVDDARRTAPTGHRQAQTR